MTEEEAQTPDDEPTEPTAEEDGRGVAVLVRGEDGEENLYSRPAR